jgi:drug/metabolite transporter (DMT)-like permease
VDDPPRDPNARLPTLGLAVSALAISTSAPLVLATTADPVAIALLRVAFMAALVAGALVAFSRGRGMRLPRREAALLLALGVVLGLHFALWIPSVRLTTVTASVVIVTSHPLLVAAAAHFWLNEKASPATIAGILLALLGVAVILGTDLARPDLTGDLLAVGGAVTLGIYLLVGRQKRRAGLPVLVYTTYVYAGAALTLLCAAILLRSPVFPISDRDLTFILAMALVPGMLGHTLYNWALRYLRATVVSVSIVFEPIGASLIALAVFGAQPPPGTALGGAITIAGILLVTRAESATRAGEASVSG